jgi:hypothetical protein
MINEHLYLMAISESLHGILRCRLMMAVAWRSRNSRQWL